MTILSAYRLDRAGVEYLLAPYSPRCEIQFASWPQPTAGPRIVVAGRGWHIGEDSWRRVIVELDDDIASWPRSHDPQTVRAVQKYLGSKRFSAPINPATGLILMYGDKPGFSSKDGAQAFEEWDAMAPSYHGWNMTFALANTIVGWGPTVVDDHTIEGIHHLENGRWVRQGPGRRIEL